MKSHLQTLLETAIRRLQEDGEIDREYSWTIPIERSRTTAHGEFASPVALGMARAYHRKPRDLAECLVSRLPLSDKVQKAVVAGPGFVNFFMTPEAFHAELREILAAGERYGRSTVGKGQRIQVEFVSANPTGPLHIGHGRGAAIGASLAALLKAVGFEVHQEYYVNDAGRQMDILATSVWLRYLELCGEMVVFPPAGYRGDYIWDIAATLHREQGDAYRVPSAEVTMNVPSTSDDAEAHIDALIATCIKLLGKARYRTILNRAATVLLEDIRDDLAQFGIHFNEWYHERALVDSGALKRVIQKLADAGQLYERDGASWFRSTAYGDEKDRVLIRENGQSTYFAADIAYHLSKLERGFERMIDIWGADHHGYVARVRAALASLGADPAQLEVLLVQFVNLFRGKEKVQMSTRSGEFITLRQLRKEVGRDAARFFFIMRKSDQHLDFDLDLARSHSADNPVYYIQYAYARICSVIRQLHEKGETWDRERGERNLHRLQEPHELTLMKTLTRYPEVVEAAAVHYEPHQLAFFLRELANEFHTYYNAHTFLVEEAPLRDARLALIIATRQVIGNGLQLLGVSAPETM